MDDGVDGSVGEPRISTDGYVVFDAEARLVDEDDTHWLDVFGVDQS